MRAAGPGKVLSEGWSACKQSGFSYWVEYGIRGMKREESRESAFAP